ncbi:hypothetical protein P4050_15985 [Pseudomonas aeruginosa]|nr:hypothetical protein [Pseudomonas aeruginosa]
MTEVAEYTIDCETRHRPPQEVLQDEQWGVEMIFPLPDRVRLVALKMARLDAADLQAFPSCAEELPIAAGSRTTARSWSGGWRQFVPVPRRPLIRAQAGDDRRIAARRRG